MLSHWEADYLIALLWGLLCFIHHYFFSSFSLLIFLAPLAGTCNAKNALDTNNNTSSVIAAFSDCNSSSLFSSATFEVQRKWRNKCTSAVHAVVLCVLVCVYVTRNFMHYSHFFPKERGVQELERQILFIMLGYLVYDSLHTILVILDEILVAPQDPSRKKKEKNSMLKNEWSERKILSFSTLVTLLYDFALLMCHIATLKFKCGLAAQYLILFYCAEVSTPFMYTCWMWTVMKSEDSKAHAKTGIVMMITLFLRNFIGLYILFSLTIQEAIWKGCSLKGRSYHKDEVLYWIMYISAVVFVVLNACTTYQLVGSVQNINKIKEK